MQVQSFSADYPKAPIYVGDLVRCKDCLHYGKNEWCEILKVESMLPDGYCAYGEHKGGDLE